MTSLAGRRILVVGASSGIGAAFAAAAIADGARVAASARRAERLDALGAEVVAPGDATDPATVDEVCGRAARALGGFDCVLYAAGIGVLNPLAEFDADAWRRVFDVNVVGANLVAAAALPHLDPDGLVVFVSSRTVSDVNWGFGPYSVSKAALDQSIRLWRVEHPERRFVRVVMGNTAPTEFGEHMGRAGDIGEAMERWGAQGIPGWMMHVDEVGQALVDALAVAIAHPTIDASELRFDARPTPDR